MTLTLGGTCGTGGAARLLLLLLYALLTGTTGTLYVGSGTLTAVVLLVEAVGELLVDAETELDFCLLSVTHCLP